jgi:hypothetical protein
VQPSELQRCSFMNFSLLPMMALWVFPTLIIRPLVCETYRLARIFFDSLSVRRSLLHSHREHHRRSVYLPSYWNAEPGETHVKDRDCYLLLSNRTPVILPVGNQKGAQ